MGTRLKMVAPPRKIIRYVEQTEGMRFKKVPTVQYSDIRERGRNHLSMELDACGRDKQVAKATITINNKYTKPIEQRNHQYAAKGVDNLVLMHELRENLHFQNKAGLSSKQVHTHVVSQEPKDVAWLKRNNFVTKLPPNKKSRNFF